MVSILDTKEVINLFDEYIEEVLVGGEYEQFDVFPPFHPRHYSEDFKTGSEMVIYVYWVDKNEVQDMRNYFESDLSFLDKEEYYVVQYSDMSRGDYVIKVLEDRDKALKVAEEECQALKREYEDKDDDYYEALEYSEF